MRGHSKKNATLGIAGAICNIGGNCSNHQCRMFRRDVRRGRAPTIHLLRFGGSLMLTCLRIRDLAIIDSLDVELGPGLNVVTGETGAGKSIMVDALELVLGAKGKSELVRTGAA